MILTCEVVYKADLIFPIYSSEFVSHFLCSTTLKACMFGECGFCRDKGDLWLRRCEKALDKEKSWYEWARNVSEENVSDYLACPMIPNLPSIYCMF